MNQDGNVRVFISYSHDNAAHKQNIVDFAQALRRAGIDAWIDEFESSPPLSWPQWMTDQIDQADYVIIVVTETYSNRFRGHERPGRGLGVRWEGAIITDHLYHATDEKVKFIPVVVRAADVSFIPPPLSLTTRYTIGTEEPRQLSALLRHLTGRPAVIAEPLGSGVFAPTDTSLFEDEVSAALELAHGGNPDEAEQRLRTIISSASTRERAPATYALGNVLHQKGQYSAAIAAYHRALEYDAGGGLSERVAERLSVVVGLMNAHLGPGSAAEAAREWLNLLPSQRNMPDIWRRIDPETRLVLAQAWIVANESHHRLADIDRESLADELAKRDPAHHLSRDFFATQWDEFHNAYQSFDDETWGVAERPRHFGVDYEVVIFMDTGGDPLTWEPEMELPAFPLLLRRRAGTWYIAGFEPAIPRPGWPPTSEALSLDGITFRNVSGDD